ncbi:zinc finger protein 253 isoform X1 [Drosophila elegans]|uniref:zinc finger protein 253 isoform X1 n=2 Tax=Drosophila elegans TaxID=30023 RepID=UPI0007E7CC2E|nr:zinc finger protein 253 isoform X1 [Drosophila elegans]
MGHLDKCRICSCGVASDDEAYNLLEAPDLAAKFTECTNLKVNPEDQDTLPSEICAECYELLEKFHSFRALCIVADKKWRSYSLVTRKKIDWRERVLEVEESEEEWQQEEETQHPLEEPELIICDSNMSPEKTPPKLKRKTIPKKVKKPPKPQPVKKAKEELPPPKFKCDICSDEFREERRLILHKKEHEGHMLYHCSEPGCEEAFNRFETLRQHELEHSEVGTRFICEEEGCNRMYRHKASLKHHQSKAHAIGKPLKTHMCEFCGRVFKNLSALSQHRFTHDDQMKLPYACEIPDCPWRFYSKEKLKIHMMRHQGIKNYSCPYCGLKKTTKNELRLHINFHTLERTWSCKDCPKVCNSSTSLKKHVRTIHEKARDFACNYCEKRFATSDTRKYHEMTHTGEKNFECHECGKRFIQPSALRTHRKIHEFEEVPQPSYTILQITTMGQT